MLLCGWAHAGEMWVRGGKETSCAQGPDGRWGVPTTEKRSLELVMEEAGPAQEPRAGHYPHGLPAHWKATVCCVCFKSQLIRSPRV